MAWTSLHVSASYFGRQVEEVFLPAGADVVLGRDGPLSVPMPPGVPYFLSVRWRRGGLAEVTDGAGGVHALEPGKSLTVEVGPVGLTLSLLQRFRLRRLEAVAWRGSLAWFVLVMAMSLVPPQANRLWQLRCLTVPVYEAWGLSLPVWMGACLAQREESGFTDKFTAEYLDRLLRQDLEGAERGAITDRWERGVHQEQREDVYLPAGSLGDDGEMEGGEDVGPDPVRTPPTEDAPEEQGSAEPIALTTDEGEGPALVEASPQQEAVEPTEEAVEDKEGWGIPDWHDAEDAAIEEEEIEGQIAMAREVLRIDPDSPYALTILAYYQYLAMDLDGAVDTYDRYIAQNPMDAAGYNNKALVYKRKGDYAQEEQLYRMALFLQKDDVTALNNLAVNLAHQGRTDEALKIMERLEALLPGDPYADLHRAKVYGARGDEETAFAYLEAALRGMKKMDTLHEIEFTQDIRVDPALKRLRGTKRFRELMWRYYGEGKEP
ncbi:MAG: tetratricopeptide repeat protein [Deltaproteobacteria bacterium]|nr:tetratricopeptide repeat protein [Deltaproteobacteria bacterium]